MLNVNFKWRIYRFDCNQSAWTTLHLLCKETQAQQQLFNENNKVAVMPIVCLVYIYTPSHYLLPIITVYPFFYPYYTEKDEGWSDDNRVIIGLLSGDPMRRLPLV